MPSHACHKAQLFFFRDLRVSVVSIFHTNLFLGRLTFAAVEIRVGGDNGVCNLAGNQQKYAEVIT